MWPGFQATAAGCPARSAGSGPETFWRTTTTSPPCVEVDHVARDHAGVDDLADRAALDVVARLGELCLAQQPDLLGTDREAPPVALEQVGDADEGGDELVCRPLVDIGGAPDLVDPTLAEDGDAVAHRQRLLLVVRDVDEGDPDLLLDPLQLALHLLPQLEIERAERLVEEQHLRVVDDRARERHPLALPAGQLDGLPVAEAVEADEFQRLLGAAPALRALHALDPQPVLDVGSHGHVREERIVLEDGVDVPVVRGPAGDVDAAELHAAGVGALEAGDDPERRRLARPGGPEHGEELAASDLQVDPVHGDDVAVGLPDSAQDDVGRDRSRRRDRAVSHRGVRRRRH